MDPTLKNEITGRTRVVGIFGDPVGHSMSPVIQNAAFRAVGLDFVYVPFHVRPEGLEDAVRGARAMVFAGLNVTIPHKVEVMKLLDKVDEGARSIGAVNTVVNKDGHLVGYNTDGVGYLRSLEEDTGFSPGGKDIIIIGAGGAARAVLHALLEKGPSRVVLANRTEERAGALADEFGRVFPDVTMETSGLDPERLEAEAGEAALVVNTTSMGMKGNPELDFPVEALKSSAVVSDIVYSPLDTGLLKRAAARGLKVHDGLSMLVAQGAAGFELWTGKKAPVDEMKRAARKALGL